MESTSRNVELARLLQAGHQEVFPEIMQIYQRRLYQTALKITNCESDAEDVVQDSFINVLEKIQQWRGENFSSWLMRICRNLAIDCLRKRHEQKKRLQTKTPFIDVQVMPDEQELIDKILQKLPQKQREILHLRHFQNCSIREIAIKQGCAQGTVKATLYQTFQKLKTEFRAAGLMG